MRILFISDVYLPRINGVSISILTALISLRNVGHEVFLIAPQYPDSTPPFSSYSASRYSAEDCVIRIPSFPVPGDHEDRLMRSSEIFPTLHDHFAPSIPASNIFTNAASGQTPFDLVHIHTVGIAHFEGIKLARKLDIPAVMTWHTHFEEYLHHYVSFMPKDITRYLTRKATTVLCNAVDVLLSPSESMKTVLEKRYRVAGEFISVVPTGINLQHFSPNRSDAWRGRKRLGVNEHRHILLYVGRVAHEKNVGFLLDILAEVTREIPDVILAVVGDGPARESLQSRASSLGLEDNIRWLGFLPYDSEDLLACYKAADLFVFASETETQGLALLEAMAMGVPVVSTAKLGTKDTLLNKDSPSVAVLDDNEELFARKVVDLLNHPKDRDEMRAKGREYVERHWADSLMAQRLAEVYQMAASTYQRGGRTKRTFSDMLVWKAWEGLIHLLVVLYMTIESLQGILVGWLGYIILVISLGNGKKWDKWIPYSEELPDKPIKHLPSET